MENGKQFRAYARTYIEDLRIGSGLLNEKAVVHHLMSVIGDFEGLEAQALAAFCKQLFDQLTREAKARDIAVVIGFEPDLFGSQLLASYKTIRDDGPCEVRIDQLTQLELRRVIEERDRQISNDQAHRDQLRALQQQCAPAWTSFPTLTVGQALQVEAERTA